MPITLGQNLVALTTGRYLQQTGSRLNSTLQSLSSGIRINRASDDAAGLSVSAGLQSDARVFSQAIRNVNDGVSLLNVASGALDELTNIVTRQAELAEQAANGIYSARQRQALHLEANSLVDEYNRIISTTEFSGLKLLDGSNGKLTIQSGYGSLNSLDVVLPGDPVSSTIIAGDGTFQSMISSTVLGAPNGMTNGDVNGDGDLDFIVTVFASSSVEVFLGNGDGSFEAAITLSAGSSPFGAVVRDFNGDGSLDIATAESGTNKVSVYLGNGDGNFKARTSFATGSLPNHIATADFNGDGAYDLVTSNQTGNSVSVLFGAGNGSFGAPSNLAVGATPLWVSVGDVNGDGATDIISANYFGNSVSVLLGNGNGTFKAASNYTAGSTPQVVQVGDLNGDGKLDLVTADYSGGTFSVLIGNGNGTFQARTSYTAGVNVYDISIGDLNGDGKLDLLTADRLQNKASVYLGNGNGTFGGRVSYAVAATPRVGAIADVNGDGAPDITVLSASTQISVLLANVTQTDVVLQSTTIDYLDLTSPITARTALDTTKSNISNLNSKKAIIGSHLSRFESTISTLAISRETYSAAASQILDADIAESTASLVRLRILQQAEALVLYNSSQTIEIALQLLGS